MGLVIDSMIHSEVAISMLNSWKDSFHGENYF